MPSFPRWALAPLLVAASTAVAVLGRLAFDRFVGQAPAFLLPFLFPVVVAAVCYGTRWGLFATALNTAAVVYFFTPPEYGFGIRDLDDRVRVGTFVVLGAVLSGITGSLRSYQLRAVVDARTMARRQTELQAEITEQRATEDRLRVSERRYRMLLEGVPQLVWTCRPDGWCDYLSRQWVEYTGVPEADQLGYAWSNAVHPDDRATMLERWQQSVRTGEPLDVEFRIRNGAGEYRWFSTRAVQFREPDGESKWFGTNTDTHDQKQAENRLVELNADLERRVAERTADLRASEERFRLAAEAAGVGVWEWDVLKNRVHWNDQMFRMYQVPPTPDGVIPYEAWSGAVLEEDLARQEESLRDTVQRRGRGTRAFRIRRPDGQCRFIEAAEQVREDADGRAEWVVGTNLDVTSRVVADQALRLSEERFRRLVEGVADHAIFMLDPDGLIVSWSPAAKQIAGYEEGDVIGRHFSIFYTPESVAAGHPQHELAVAVAAGRYQEEGLRVRKDGATFWADVTISALRDESGRLVGFVKFTHDITARKQAEEALRSSEERLRLALRGAEAGVWECTLPGWGSYWSPEYRDMYGFTAEEEARADKWRARVHPDDLPRIEANLAATAEPGKDAWQQEFRLVVPGRGVRWVLDLVRVIRGPDGSPTGVGGVNIDITARKRAEELVLASLREKEVLLKEIHHRVKNNLQIVSALLDLQSEHTSDPAVLTMFKESRGRVKSMAMIHERLYRSQDMARVNFTEYVRQLADDLYHTYKVSDDDIRLELDVDIPPLPIDIAIPCGLLLNELMSNCFKHAFKDVTEGCIRVSLHRAGDDTNVLSVADDGAGFPAGTDFRNTASFGMQLVNTLADQLDGESELTTGRGTTVTVRFPKPKK